MKPRKMAMKSRRGSSVQGVGVDIERVENFKKILKNRLFLKKIFTDREIKYCRRFKDPAPHLAAKFAGKEAVFKAMGIDPKEGGISLKDFEILNTRYGAPYIKVNHEKLKARFKCLISVSHTKDLAIAVSMAKEF